MSQLSKRLLDNRLGVIRRVVRARATRDGQFIRVEFAYDPSLSDELNRPVLVPCNEYKPLYGDHPEDGSAVPTIGSAQ